MSDSENIEIEHVIDDIEDHINEEYDGAEYDKMSEDLGPLAGISLGLIVANILSMALDANYARMGATTMTTPSEKQLYASGIDLMTARILPKGKVTPELVGAFEFFGTGAMAYKARKSEAMALRAAEEKTSQESDQKGAA